MLGVVLEDKSDSPPLVQQLVRALATNLEAVIDGHIFDHWDADNDGTVSRAEFHAAMHELGLNHASAAVDELFDAWDTDRTGSLSLQEVYSNLYSESSIAKLRDQLARSASRCGATQINRSFSHRRVSLSPHETPSCLTVPAHLKPLMLLTHVCPASTSTSTHHLISESSLSSANGMRIAMAPSPAPSSSGPFP